MRAHVREKTGSAERFALSDVAYMYFHYRNGAIFYRIAERYTRMTVAACVEHDAIVWTLALTLTVGFLYPVYQVTFVVRLLIYQMYVRQVPLYLQQNLCHTR